MVILIDIYFIILLNDIKLFMDTESGANGAGKEI
jgi:hypothetical protein